MMPRPEAVFFVSPADFRAWLQEHHVAEDELWVGYWKKATGRPSLTWEESVDEALCFGWIDGIRRSIDAAAYRIRFTPRRTRSIWSLRNLDRYRVLEAEGRIAPAGARAFSLRRDEDTGLYSFEQPRERELAEAYRARLEAHPEAWQDWCARPPGYRRQVIHWIMSAKREETRQRRLASLIEDCAAHRKIKPLRP